MIGAIIEFLPSSSRFEPDGSPSIEQTRDPSLFDGLSDAQLQQVMEHAERIHFPPGTVIISEGEYPGHLYVVESGGVEVFVAGPDGSQHLVNRLGPGSVLGEMSFLSGGATSATVRASGEVWVISLSHPEVHRAATLVPRLYANVGAIVAAKLSRSDRRPFRAGLERVTLLQTEGAPSILGYALACSIAWFSRSRVLFLLLRDEPPADLAALALPAGPMGRVARAVLRTEGSTGPFAPDRLPLALEELCQHYDHVLVQGAGPISEVRTRTLVGTERAGGPDSFPGHTLRAWSKVGTGRPGQDGVLHIPPPAGSELEALRRGILSPALPMGRSLGWAARDLTGLKIGLALGSGSWRGYAHIGVIRCLRQVGVEPDFYAGTSIGSVVATTFARGDDLESVGRMLDDAGKNLITYTLPIRSFLSNRGIVDMLQRACGETRIEELPVPLAVVAADLNSSSEVVFRRGLLRTAVLASISVPGIWPALEMGPYLLVDGGVLNPLPTSVVTEMGADVVVGVRLMAPIGRPVHSDAGHMANGDVYAPRAILRSIDLLQSQINVHALGASAIVIDPDLSGITPPGVRRFSDGRAAIEPGEAAAQAALPRLEAVLPWLRERNSS